MPRKTDLEGHIRESHKLICEFEDILRLSNNPKEQARARRAIKEQWELIRGYLAEYALLCERLSLAMPEDIAEIAVIVGVPLPSVPSAQPPPEPVAAPSATVPVGSFATAHAFLIGVGDYTHPRFASLPATVRDAQAIAAVLTDPARCGYPPANVQTITGPDATAANIRAALKTLAKSTHLESTAFLYFSGHGGRALENGVWRAYLCPREADPDDLAHTAIPGDEFSGLLAAIPARKLLVMLDACHAAGSASLKGADGVLVWKAGLPDTYYEALSQGSGRVVIASSKEDQFSYVRPQGDLSLFTHHLRDALGGKAAVRGDGLIHVLDVFHHVSDAVQADESKQTPILKVKDLDLNFPIALALGGKTAGPAISVTPVVNIREQIVRDPIQVDQALAVAIGDQAHVEQHFHPAPPLPPPASRDELLEAVRQANAELRAYPSDVAGIHIDRVEVAETIEWVLRADPKERLGMLQDQPGSGKTVVMCDVLEQLEAKGVPVLAIKADTLSGIKARSDLADRLGLPAPVEECARTLASEDQCVVLLDQLDALSLALSRDQATLDVMLSTLARLRDLDDVRIVASCRTFELNNDPRLSTIKVDRKFQLQPLDDSEVNRVLQAIGIDASRLLSAHRALLTVPLHLKVYAQVIAGDTPQGPPEGFRTLQELYEALWQKRITAVPPDTPHPSERIAAIYQLVETMQTRHQLTAPVAVLDEYPEAASYLEREGFIRRERGNWLFFHQTLFDYCYARRFVAEGKSPSREILDGPQGLFERSQMVQVLAYLRGADEAAYCRELTHLLFTDDLRVHLRLLLIGWFGSLPDPTADELRIARQLMSDVDDQARFLQAAGGNEGWFDPLSEDMLPSLLQSNNGRLIDVVVNYLGTLVQHRTDAVLAHLRSHLGASEAWDDHIAFCLSRLDTWNDEALDLLCDLLQRGRAGGWGDHCLYKLANANPAAGCQALRAYLDHRLDDLLAQEQARSEDAEHDPVAPYRTGLPDRFNRQQYLLGEYAVGEVTKAAVHNCPEAIIEYLLPWFVRVVLALTEPRERDDYYPSDTLFAWGWYDEHISEGADFARRMAEALRHLAQTKPSAFRVVAAELAAIESLAVQRVLAQAYLSKPETYASDIFEYLTTDRRRLNIGEELENPRYDSCRLYGAAFRYVDANRRAVLEQLILDLMPTWERRRSRGITQLRFLKGVPPDLLSQTARDRLGELERKFPDFELRPPEGSRGGFVGPPISQASQEKMSDDNWLSAMRRYDDSGYEHPDFLKGGVRQLSSGFAKQVKANPERFYRLAQRFDETIPLHYITAAISGLADSDAPAEWVFELVRQFAPRISGEFRRGVCWALEKQAKASVPDDLLDVLTDWALHDVDPAEELWRTPAGSGEPYYSGDPHHHGINTNRGAAIEALCHCALARTPPQVERAFQLLEQAASDPSTAVRTCVIERLGPMLQHDETRALDILEQTLDGHPRLLQSPVVHHFLYWTYYQHFQRIHSFIEALLSDTDDVTRQAGASLACLAAFQYPEAGELAERAMGGDAPMRRGAARVYARNLENRELETNCQEPLLQLMHDPDEQVHAHVGECFRYLHPEHLGRLRPFLEEFLASPALMSGAEHLIKYLAPLAADAPDLTLEVTECILEVAGSEVTDVRTATSILERDLVRLPLAVYTHTFDPAEKSRAMDVFEWLLLLGSRMAHQALADWDRR